MFGGESNFEEDSRRSKFRAANLEFSQREDRIWHTKRLNEDKAAINSQLDSICKALKLSVKEAESNEEYQRIKAKLIKIERKLEIIEVLDMLY